MFFLGSQLKRRTAVLLSRAAFSFSIFSVAVLVPLSLLLLPPPVCFHAVSDNPPARRRVFLSLSPLTSPRPWPLLRWGSAGNYDLSPRDGDMPAQCRKDGGGGSRTRTRGFQPRRTRDSVSRSTGVTPASHRRAAAAAAGGFKENHGVEGRRPPPAPRRFRCVGRAAGKYQSPPVRSRKTGGPVGGGHLRC